MVRAEWGRRGREKKDGARFRVIILWKEKEKEKEKEEVGVGVGDSGDRDLGGAREREGRGGVSRWLSPLIRWI